ncbi:MAG: aminoacyl-tRNA hydrolase [Chloroflexi bacterium]|nr:aminoacyl-tRNA hydrolase [Chloroflexota bacterium]|tara:strand:+ start:3679 stop:4275 length:597 start_codon:yes stop_codon:yes gene_type:complete
MKFEDFSNNNNAPWIIIGLGNPGSKYNNTRHNIGWAILDKINKNHNVSISKNNKDYYFSSISLKNSNTILIYPATYINNSGDIVKKIVKKFNSKKIIVVYDDINLETGRIRIRKNGSAGGHNGMKSIINSIQSEDFMRVRVGISEPKIKSEQISYVLGKFSPEEKILINKSIDRCIKALEIIIEKGIDEAMNLHNSQQ